MQARAVIRYDADGHTVRYPSIVEAARATGASVDCLYHALRSRTGHSSGYTWRYAPPLRPLGEIRTTLQGLFDGESSLVDMALDMIEVDADTVNAKMSQVYTHQGKIMVDSDEWIETFRKLKREK